MYEGEIMALTKLKIEENILEEAGFMSKSFVQEAIKNRAYINIVGAELLKKYLESECGIKTEDLSNIHSITRILECLDIADIILPNIHIDARVIFDEEQIFIPKSHFENGYLPDVYFILKLSDNFDDADFLGFIEPKNIDKNKANEDYYFVDKDELEHTESFNSFVCSFSSDKNRDLSDDDMLAGRELSISLADHNISSEDFRKLISLLVASKALRESIIEYDNFETLSYSVVSEISIQKVSESDTQHLNDSDVPSLQDYNYDDSGLETSPETVTEPENNLNDENIGEILSAGSELAAGAAGIAAAGGAIAGGAVSADAINLANTMGETIDGVVENKVNEQYINIDKVDNTNNDVYTELPEGDALFGLPMDTLEMPKEINEEDFSVNVDDLETVESNQYTPISNDESVVGLNDLPAAQMEVIEEFDHVTDFENISSEDKKYTMQSDTGEQLSKTPELDIDLSEKSEPDENSDSNSTEDLILEDSNNDNLSETELENFEIADFEDLELDEINDDIIETTVQESQDLGEESLSEGLLQDEEIEESENVEGDILDDFSEISYDDDSNSDINLSEDIDLSDDKENSEFQYETQNEDFSEQDSTDENVGDIEFSEDDFAEINLSDDDIISELKDENMQGNAEDNQNLASGETENTENEGSFEDLNLSDTDMQEFDKEQDAEENEIKSDFEVLPDENSSQEEEIVSDVNTADETINDINLTTDSAENIGNIDESPVDISYIDDFNQEYAESVPEGTNIRPEAYYNSVSISSKTPVVGEIAIDANVPEVSYQEHEHLENIYNESADLQEGSILSNPARFIRGKEGKNSPMMLAIAGGVLVLAIIGIIGMSAMKMLKPAEEQNAGLESNIPPVPETPATSNPPALNVNTEKVVSMDNKPIAQDSQRTPAPAVRVPKPLPANVYLEANKIGWEIPDYISYDSNFKKYFQSSGKSLKSALSSDLLLATEYPYSDQIRLSVLYDKSGMFKDAKVLLSSGSAQIDKIVLQSVNHTLKALKAPASIGKDESTTVILKIYF